MSDTTQTTDVGTGKRTKSRRQRILPFDTHVLNFRAKNPDYFNPYEPTDIAAAMLKAGILANENVQLELAEQVLQTFRRRFDPSFTATTPSPRVKVKMPDKDELASLVLGAFKASTVMRDGRPLGEWTFGEFRQEFAGMSGIIAKFAHLPDDALMGDHLTD